MGPQYSNDFEECTRYFGIWIRILKPDQYCRLGEYRILIEFHRSKNRQGKSHGETKRFSVWSPLANEARVNELTT